MARLPDRTDLGARPIPSGRRAIVADNSGQIVADAVSNVGERIEGQAAAVIEKEDKLAYGAAKTALLKADVEARSELEQDGDYETYESRYNDRMNKAREAATSLIQSRSDRAAFEMESTLDIDRGKVDVLKAANGKRVAARKGVLATALDELHGVSRTAMDDATRQEAINTAGTMIDGAVGEGTLDPDDAVVLRRKWTDGYLTDQVTSALLQEKPERAEQILAANSDKMDWRTRLDLTGKVKAAMDDRQAMADVMPAFELPAIREDAKNPKAPTEDGVKAIKQIFPGVNVTSGYRGSNHPLSKKNPASWHAKSHAAVDVAPIKGMAFSDFVGQIEQSGYKIIEAIDETGSGKTAHATGDHWHVVLGTGSGGIKSEARRWDKENIYRDLEDRADKEGWSPERLERARDFADKRVKIGDDLAKRREDDAAEEAMEVIKTLGDNFTDISQIPGNKNLSSTDWIRFDNAAKSNVKGMDEKKSDDVLWGVKLEIAKDPEAFKHRNLKELVGVLKPSEIGALQVKQAEMNNETPKTTALRGRITATIATYKTPDMKLNSTAEGQARFLAVHDLMTQTLSAYAETGKPITDALEKEAFVKATRDVLMNKTGFFGTSRTTRKIFDFTIANVPEKDQDAIKKSYAKQYNREPTDDEIVAYFRRKIQ